MSVFVVILMFVSIGGRWLKAGDTVSSLSARRDVTRERVNSRLLTADSNDVTRVVNDSDVTSIDAAHVVSKNTTAVETMSRFIFDRNSAEAEDNVNAAKALEIPSTFPGMDTSVTWHCDVMLCETESGKFLVDAAACSRDDKPVINTTGPFAVSIVVKPSQVQSQGIRCQVTIAPHKNHYINVTVAQLPCCSVGYFRLWIQSKDEMGVKDRRLHISNEDLEHQSVNFLSLNFVRLIFLSSVPYPTQAVTMHVDVKEGTYMSPLPVVMLSETVGYVTSPGFDDNQKYPNNYDGGFTLNIADNESVLVNFVSFHVGSRITCKYTFLRITHMTMEHRQEKTCGTKGNIDAKVFRNSINLHLHTDSDLTCSGFKIMFAILPRSQEPKQLPSNLFNCSVPSFKSFRPVFSCNMLTECEGNEDEQDCGYLAQDCGIENTIDTGTKCFNLVVHQRRLTWFDAHKACIRRGQNLATLENPDEWRQFKEQVRPVVNLEGYFVGARLLQRQQAVSITALYRNIWQWVDGGTVLSLNIHDIHENKGSCALYDPWLLVMDSISCHEQKEFAAFVCEFYKQDKHPSSIAIEETGHSVSIDTTAVAWNVSVVLCSGRHVTRDFLSCDFQSDCNSSYSVQSCSTGGVTIPMFLCQRSRTSVHYTLVCDYTRHCSDNSDEDFCEYPECSSTSLECHNSQCVDGHQLCDGTLDCYDGSDEAACQPDTYRIATASPPGSIYFDGIGKYRMERMNDSDECPPTHFLCPLGFCLPVYLLCNGIKDCVGRDDEVGCDSYICHGFYRCRGSRACLHPEHVCDGIPQCPEQDDELLCDLTCPDVCRCQGLAFVCTSNFTTTSHLALRYLDASGSNMTPIDVRDNLHLIALLVKKCRITSLPKNMTFPNLRELDLSWNKLYRLNIYHIHSLKNLRVIVLRGNPLVEVTNSESFGSTEMLLEHVDLSHTDIGEFSGKSFASCPYLAILNISWSKLTSIDQNGFQFTPRLESVDLRGSHLNIFPKSLLRHLKFLKNVYAENYKLCCEALLPVRFDPKNCYSTQDLLASCEDLLKSDSYRIFLWIFAFLSLLGNVFSVGARLHQQHAGEAVGSFTVFVIYLSVADFLMGVYMAITGAADLVYRGQYLWRDDEWKTSVACNIAGFLCLLSSETSAFIICLITLDRFLVLRFPFSRLHFGRQSAQAACGVVWAVGMSLAAIPLLPVVSHWEFYSQTGICIPLPFTSRDIFRGYDYSFGVSILLNMVLFFLIAVGQAIVYQAVRANSLPSSTNTRSRDAVIARRLITVVVSDFLCWFPIGLLGLLASTGTPIPGDINVAVATFVLPVNSALNPFLYTFNLLMEKRRKAQTEILLKRLEQERCDRVKVPLDKSRKTAESTDKTVIIQQIKRWINEQLLTQEDLLSCS